MSIQHNKINFKIIKRIKHFNNAKTHSRETLEINNVYNNLINLAFNVINGRFQSFLFYLKFIRQDNQKIAKECSNTNTSGIYTAIY